MLQAFIHQVAVTTGFVPLVAGRTQLAVAEIQCAAGNAGNVTFKGVSPAIEVPWVPGEHHTFYNIDIATIRIKGTVDDVVSIIGND